MWPGGTFPGGNAWGVCFYGTNVVAEVKQRHRNIFAADWD